MSNRVSRERVDAFLTELTELSKKHGIVIDGCGCCSSPYVRDEDKLNSFGYGIDSTSHTKEEPVSFSYGIIWRKA